MQEESRLALFGIRLVDTLLVGRRLPFVALAPVRQILRRVQLRAHLPPLLQEHLTLLLGPQVSCGLGPCDSVPERDPSQQLRFGGGATTMRALTRCRESFSTSLHAWMRCSRFGIEICPSVGPTPLAGAGKSRRQSAKA